MDFTVEQIERFWAKVDKNGENGCWLWLANKNQTGYGRWRKAYKEKWVFAHRMSFFLTNGELPPIGMVLDHLCEVKSCVNPKHLDVTTSRTNVMRSRKFWETRRKPIAKSKGGVYFSKIKNRWIAIRKENGKRVHVGQRQTREEALQLLA